MNLRSKKVALETPKSAGVSKSLGSMAAGTETPVSASLLITELNKLRESFSTELVTALSPIRASLDSIYLTTIETCLTDHSDRLTSMEAAITELVAENLP